MFEFFYEQVQVAEQDQAEVDLHSRIHRETIAV
jgi:hypothetical protein